MCDNTSCYEHSKDYYGKDVREDLRVITVVLTEEWDEDGEPTYCDWCEACRYADDEMIDWERTLEDRKQW